MKNLVPHFILEKHAAGERQGRFSAASLFVDISGFSAITNALMEHGSEAAEAMADVMCGVFEPLVEAVYAQGGFITTFAGDAFTALFPREGFETEVEAYHHALAAAVHIQQHMADHPLQTTPYGSFPFAIKLGLANGGAEWGILQPDRKTAANAENEVKAAYFFSGPAVDGAAAAEHQAQPGDLILSTAVHEALASLVTTEAAGEAHFRVTAIPGRRPDPRPVDLHTPYVEHMVAFLPSLVCQPDCRGEFRQVLSLFVQLQGIDTREQLAMFIQSIFELQARYGGYLNQVDFGDKGCNLLLFWGTPTSFENDIERALNFILELPNITPTTFRTGITYAPMYTGLVGSPVRGEFTCYGSGVVLAARMMTAAPWGDVWLDERVANRARGHYLIEREGEHSFKGFDQPQPVYTLVERQALDIAGFYQGEMVGRQAELAQLEAFVQPLLAPQGEGDPAGRSRFTGVLVVEGEAGLGKSRLVHEFLARPSQFPNFQTFLCQTDQTVRQPLNPFCYWLRNYFGQSPAQSATRNKRAFGRRLDQLIAAVPDDAPQAEALRQELNRGRSFLGALIGLHWPNSPYAQLDPQGRQEWTVTALKSLILAESRRRPVILNLEDAHWLDAESVAFVQRLVRQVDDYPLAILATARPTVEDKPLFGQAAYQKVDLAVMQEADLLQLATNLLEGAIGAGLAALLAERAEGNPFFAEQILLYLQEEGGIEPVEERWQLVGGRVQGSPLPADVRAIFIARLDRLTSEIKDIVQTAAILGREFEVRVLAHMLRDDEALPDKVQSAEEQAIWTVLSQVRYIFKHALLRDAAYEMQLRARRRELHRLAAETLEMLYADDPSADAGQGLAPHYGEIAYHYEAACRQGLAAAQPQAQVYLKQAGEQAASDYENAAAADYYRRALALTPDNDAEGRYALLLGREAVYHLQGEREAQAGDLDELEILAQARQRPTEQAEVALRRARYANAISDYQQAIEQAQATKARAQAAGDVGQEAAGQLAWGEALRRQGEYPAAGEHLGQALALAGAAGRRDLEADSLLNLGEVARRQGDYAAAQGHYEKSLAIDREIGDRQGESMVLKSLGSVALQQGDYAGARGYYEKSLAIGRETGDRKVESASLNNLGIVAYEQGDNTVARGYYEKSLAIKREIGDRSGKSASLNNLGAVAREQGDYAGARGYYEKSLAIERETGDRQGESGSLYNLGGVASDQGDYAGARDYYEQSLAIDREIGDRQGEGQALYNLGTVAGSQGDYVGAQGYYEQSLAIGHEIGDRRNEGYALTGLGDVLVGLGNTAEAIDLLHQVISLRHELGNIVLLMESLATLARAHLAQEDTTQALAVVEDILSFLGSPYLDEGGHPSTGSRHGFDGAEQPLRNYLTCYLVLQAAGDLRAAGVLQAASNQLQEQAARIPDEEIRRSLLENVPWHREIVAACRGEEAGEIDTEMRDREGETEQIPIVVKAAPVEMTAPEAPVVAEVTVEPVPETELVEAVAVQPAAAKVPSAEAAAVQPEAEPAAMGTAEPVIAAEESPVKPATTAAARLVAEVLAAKAPGITLIVYGDVHVHIYDSTGISIGKQTMGTPKKKAKKSKKKKKRSRFS